MSRDFVEPDEINLCKGCPEEMPMKPTNPPVPEKAHWSMAWRIDKYDGDVSPEDLMRGAQPAETLHVEGNILVNAGLDRLLDLLIGAGGQAYNGTHARIGVGDSSTAAAASQTDLQAASGSAHRQFVLVDSVSRSGETLTFQATFSTSLANFAWSEACIDAGTANGTTVTAPMLNRKIISAGTKTSAQAWVCTGTLTIS